MGKLFWVQFKTGLNSTPGLYSGNTIHVDQRHPVQVCFDIAESVIMNNVYFWTFLYNIMSYFVTFLIHHHALVSTKLGIENGVLCDSVLWVLVVGLFS